MNSPSSRRRWRQPGSARGRPPHRPGVQLREKFRGDVAQQPLLVGWEVGEEQVAADACGDRGEAALHARHIADRYAEADEAGRVLDVDVL